MTLFIYKLFLHKITDLIQSVIYEYGKNSLVQKS